MEYLLELVSERVLVRNAVATVILVVAVLLLRRGALRFLQRADWASDQIQLRWTVQVRWACVLLLTLGLMIIWAAELRTLALSVVAVTAAIVVATKELILCISGSVLRATSGCFSIGDRIEVDGVRGDVIDMRALTTTILEIGPGHRRTGRAVVIPNSVLLSKPVTNETFTEDFVVHMITIPIDSDDDWQDAEQRLLAGANEICKPFIEEARRHLDRAARHHGLPSFSVEPNAHIQALEPGKLNLLLRVPSRARDKGNIEQQILRRFFETSKTPPQES